MDKTALTISKTRQGSILAEGSIFAESTLPLFIMLMKMKPVFFFVCIKIYDYN